MGSRSHLASLWGLDSSVAYLNHGSFGACPKAIVARQNELRMELEREPVDFLVAQYPARIGAARAALGQFLGAGTDELVFVPNATSGVNAVLRSLSFEPGDEIIVTDHTYAACRKTVDYVTGRSGARAVTASLPFRGATNAGILQSILGSVTPRTRLALIDHVTSPTALVMPLQQIVTELQGRGIDVLVDGAHAPGMVPLQLTALGAAYYTGNAHKWLCAPKGAAFLHVRADRQPDLHPNVLSHGYGSGFHAEFDWTGTFDPTAYLCVQEAVDYLGKLLPGGWPQIMRTNRDLCLEARRMLLEICAIEAPCAEDLLASMASIPLPAAAPGSPAHGLDCQGLHDWFRERGIETWVYAHPVPLLRISAQLYNDLNQFERLALLLREALRGG